MQVTDKQKRANILSAAAVLFATQAFHKVLLSDVAEKAGVGKGTLYIYFKNKEDLYFSVLLDGFSSLVERIHLQLDETTQGPMENLEQTIREIVRFAFQDRHLFNVMRTLPIGMSIIRERWLEKRRELIDLILSIITQGIKAGVFYDPHPELTAGYIPGLVRSALLNGTDGIDPDVLSRHIIRFVTTALTQSGELKATL
ncbi:MAG: TetR/AcrR family transcriptional regulator [Proteobacteria bacterium]|nr:TetR/AcrR family transcriptional regulator [Pseudomonadota bacterium]